MTGSDFLLTMELDHQTRSAHVDPGRPLADVLRAEFGRTGTHLGCRTGDCGACTVLVDDEPYKACLVPCARVDGHRVETVQGLAAQDEVHPVQEAFWEANGFQCGFCLAGPLLCTVAMLRNRAPIADEAIDQAVDQAIAGNLCRCTGYQQIRVAVRTAITARNDTERSKHDGHAQT
ncbi:(2Fe-2S)-binding protein [Streptomyces mirabilis]